MNFVGDDAPYKSVSIGSIQIIMHNGAIRTLIEVQHVSELKKNLGFVGGMDSQCFFSGLIV